MKEGIAQWREELGVCPCVHTLLVYGTVAEQDEGTLMDEEQLTQNKHDDQLSTGSQLFCTKINSYFYKQMCLLTLFSYNTS